MIIATIVYLSAFSLVIRMLLSGRKKHKVAAKTSSAAAETKPAPGPSDGADVKGGEEA